MKRTLTVPFLVVPCLLAPCLGQDVPAADAETRVLEGRVLDAQRQPLAGVAIGAFANTEYTTAGVMAEPRATTGADGRFEFSVPKTVDAGSRVGYLVFAKRGKVAVEVRLGTGALDEDIVLADGATFVGWVRNSGGKPLVGVKVTGTDATEGKTFIPGDYRRKRITRATTDAKGTFKLEGSLMAAMDILCEKPGYQTRVFGPLSFGEPIVAELAELGVVRGRVTGPDGKPIAAVVYVTYESASGAARITTEDDGLFEIGLSQPSRLRIHATSKAPVDGSWLRGNSEILSAPRDDVTLTVRTPAEPTKKRLLFIDAVDRESGKPIAKIAAAVYWQDAGRLQNMGPWVDQQLDRQRKKSVAGEQFAVSGPRDGGPFTAAVKVWADGYATQKKTDFSWEDDEAESQRITLELEREAVVKGIVVDQDTGEPIVGASVESVAKAANKNNAIGQVLVFSGPTQGQDDSAPKTDENGRFVLRGLAAGRYELRVTHRDRPDADAHAVELELGEALTDVEIKSPRGATIYGKLTGAPIESGWRIHARAIGNNNAMRGRVFSSAGGVQQAAQGVLVGDDGTFEVEGLSKGNYELDLWMPAPPRGGPPQCITLDPVRIKKVDENVTLDLADDMPGVLAGRIAMKGSSIPGQRLIVSAQLRVKNRPFFYPYPHVQGPFTLVEADGSYRLRLAPGDYDVRVLDLATGLMFHGSSEPVEIESAKDAEHDIEFEVVKALVKLVPENEGDAYTADRLDIVADMPNPQGINFGNRAYDRRMGIDIRHRPTELTLYVPVVDLTLRVWSQNRLTEDRQSKAIAEFEFTAAPGEINEWTVKMPPPPELD